MKDPVIERKMSQFREGSLSFNRGIPIYSEKPDRLPKKFKLRTHHPKSWILSWLFFGGGEALPGSPSLFGHDWSSQCIRYRMTENRQRTHRSQNDPDSAYLRIWLPDNRSNKFFSQNHDARLLLSLIF